MLGGPTNVLARTALSVAVAAATRRRRVGGVDGDRLLFASTMIRPGANPMDASLTRGGVQAAEASSVNRNSALVMPGKSAPGAGAASSAGSSGSSGSTSIKDKNVLAAQDKGGKRNRRATSQAAASTAIHSPLVDAVRPYSSARLNAVRNSSISKRPGIPDQHPNDYGKLTVILDVDETLIHSRLSSQQESFRQQEDRKDGADACDEFTIHLEDGETVRVNKRPGLDAFLQHMSQNYETFAYTAGLEEYARPLLDWLDPTGTIFRYRLYRDSCLFVRGYYLKDLQKVNRPLSRAVLVDNNAFCFLPQLSNGIPISSFYDDPNDTALSVLMTFLDRIKDEKDVRPFLRKSFNLETLLKEHREQIVG